MNEKIYFHFYLQLSTLVYTFEMNLKTYQNGNITRLYQKPIPYVMGI